MKHFAIAFLTCFFTFAYSQSGEIVKPISVDRSLLSGLDLKAVKNKDQPNRRLFQKVIFWGKEIGVFVVSSETATAQQDNYAMEEFIYLLNGRSRMNPVNGDEVIFKTGDYFVAPKGFTGEWETQGGDEFLIELSVIAVDRPPVEVAPEKTIPLRFDRDILSGYGLTIPEDQTISHYFLYKGPELTSKVALEKPGTRNITSNQHEQLHQVISGVVTVSYEGDGEVTYYKGDWFVLPRGFSGTWKTEAHGLFRSLIISRSK